MLRKFLCVGAIALFASSAQAGILFDKSINLNLDAVNASLTDIANVDGMDFGSNALGSSPTGRVAVNTTDNGDGVFGIGDTIKSVGHALIEEVSIAGGSTLNPIDTGQSPSFQLTGQLRDLLGTVGVGGGGGLANIVTSGFLDLYLDDSGVNDFLVGDATTSANGTKVATFQLIDGTTTFTGGPISTSEFVFKLIDQLGSGTATLTDDFFQLTSGANPLDGSSLLATQIVTFDVRTDDTLTGISGGGDPLDIGSGFSPAPLPSGDFYANVDGSGAFGVVPEPASVLAFVGIGFAGLASRRRRKA